MSHKKNIWLFKCHSVNLHFSETLRIFNSHHFQIASPATATQRAKATEMPLSGLSDIIPQMHITSLKVNVPSK